MRLRLTIEWILSRIVKRNSVGLGETRRELTVVCGEMVELV